MAIFQNSIIPAAAAAPADDVVTKSLRFEKSSTSNLHQDNPTPDSARKMTLSFWVKLVETPSSDPKLFAFGGSAAAGASQSEQEVIQKAGGAIYVRTNVNNSGVYSAVSTRVFRDFSSWYHIVIAWDTAQSVAADRMKFYVNNEQETLTGSFPPLNYDDRFGETGYNVKNRIGCGVNGASTYAPSSSYMADVIRIDGQQLTPSSFAEEDATTGQWKPKDTSGLTFGSAGFHLDFEDDTDIGNDVSGNDNDFTATNLAASDVVNDVPTDNYAVLNPLVVTHSGAGDDTFSEGNTKVVTETAGRPVIPSTIFMPPDSGTYYAEFTLSASGAMFGIVREDSLNDADAYYDSKSWGYYGHEKVNGGSATALSGSAPSYPAKLGASYNTTTGELKFYVGGADVGGFTSLSTDYSYGFFVGDGSGAVSYTITTHFDSDDWDNTPSGVIQLSTGNLPTPTIAKPAEYFSATTYTGNSTTNAITTGLQPDLLWIKSRGVDRYHNLFDSVRELSDGALYSNTADTADGEERIASLDTNGFTTSSTNYTYTNNSGEAYVAWGWKKDTAAGFNIVGWTGDAEDYDTGTQVINHGLTVAPEMIIAKGRTANDSMGAGWFVYHKDTSTDTYLVLNTSHPEAGDEWTTMPITSIGTTSVNVGTDDYSIYLNYGGDAYSDADTYVAYFFASVEGYSKCGSYEGNNSADGPFVYCGFRPRWICVRRIDGIGSWIIVDTARDPYNDTDATLAADTASDESSYAATSDFDILSNGFKLRHSVTYGYANQADTYIFYAVAESPLKYANAR